MREAHLKVMVVGCDQVVGVVDSLTRNQIKKTFIISIFNTPKSFSDQCRSIQVLKP